jgi:sigma-B regulation protein RsbU (phosphoserine phosphatase)
MPEGEGGFLKKALTLKEPEIVPNIVHDVTKNDLKVLPWLADMKTALIVPTIGVKGEPATSILFAHEEDAYKFDDIWRNVILTYSITNIILNLLLRRETDKAYRALDEELNVIGHIQRQLLPEKLPSTDGLDWAAYYSTSARAGGDYYDFFPLPDDRIGVIIADVSGHGSPAAVVMSMTRLLMHTYPGEINPPVEVMRKMNEILMGHILPGQFVTAFYGVIDLKQRTLTCSSAGHCHPRIFRAKASNVEKLDVKGGLPLGVSSDGGFDQTSISFDKDDVLLFYTDGLTEALSKSKDMYGEGRLEEVLNRSSMEAASQIKNFLLEDVTKFAKGVPLKDDMTIIVAKATR